MSALPRLSIVIPTRNRAALLRDSLASLCTQTLPAEEFEVVVVDDGSTDDTPATCAAFAGRLPLTYHHIAPSGISAAKNLGTFAAAAPIVLFFDDDDVADPDLARQHVLTHEQHPDPAVAVLGRTVWSPALEVTDVMRYATDVGKFLFDYTCITDGDTLDHTFFWGGRTSCKRLFLAAEGIFDQAFRFGSEDIELGYRLARRGLKVVYNAKALSFMNRAVTFAELCARNERQGRSQHHFGVVLHGHDPDVRRYCDVDDAPARWREVSRELDTIVARVHELEDRRRAGRTSSTDELFALYGRAFRAFRLKGLVEAAAS
jgi:glycosyltransferase involved in cell wall biosynthesis